MTTFPDLLTSFATTWASAEKTRAQSDFFKSVEAATASARADFDGSDEGDEGNESGRQ